MPPRAGQPGAADGCHADASRRHTHTQSALMQDQVEALQAKGVAADFLSSTRAAAERAAIMARLAPSAAQRDRLALLFVTPELLATER